MNQTLLSVRLYNQLFSEIEQLKNQQQINRNQLINRAVAAGLKAIAENSEKTKPSED